jgi:Na+/proline symporter
MLGSSLVGYNYGVAGPFYFAAGCSPMIVFFSLLGISCKLKIPEAHTLLEIVRIRYGKKITPRFIGAMANGESRDHRSLGIHVFMSGE